MTGDQEGASIEALEKTNERKFDSEYAQAEYTPKKKKRKRK